MSIEKGERGVEDEWRKRGGTGISLLMGKESNRFRSPLLEEEGKNLSKLKKKTG